MHLVTTYFTKTVFFCSELAIDSHQVTDHVNYGHQECITALKTSLQNAYMQAPNERI